MSFVLSLEIPAMYFPSGDHRDPKIPCEPASTDVWRVFMSTSLIAEFVPTGGSLLEKARMLPSGDQVGSNSGNSSEVRRRGVPPSLETVNICQVFPGTDAANAICEPSGDQCAS